MTDTLRLQIDAAWEDRSLLGNSAYVASVRETIEALDKGRLRVAEKKDDVWMVNEWVKKAVLLYFSIQKMQTLEAGPFEYYDNI